RTDGRKAGLERRYLPLIVGGREVEHFPANVQLSGAEERTLEAERVAGAIRSRFVRHMAGDVRVVERLVIEHRRAETERRHEAVDRREPVLAVAEIRNQFEPAGGSG